MKIYVAGSSRDLHHVRVVQARVKSLGHEVTYDWTLDVERYGPGQLANPDNAAWCANNDTNAVLESELVIVVAHHRMWGAMVELGIAIARDIPVWVCEEWESPRYSVFLDMRGVTRGCSLDRIQRRLIRDAAVLDL